MADENIVQMPSVLERLATRINAYLKRDAANRTEWIEIQEGICCALAEAREQFVADIPFGQWCENNGFGKDRISHQDRAAAISMGSDPSALYACLKATERRSIRLIYENDFSRFTSAGKPATRRRSNLENKPSPQFLKAKQAILDLQAEGKEVSHKAVMERAGVSDTPVRTAMAQAKLEAELVPFDPKDFKPSQEKRFELALKRARAEIREELKAEVFAELDVFMRHRKEKIEWAEKIEKNFKGVITRDTFNLIRACLHPDHNTFARAAEAFDTFVKLEKVLVKPEPTPWPASAVPLPKTVEELMAQRRTKWR